MNGDVAAVNPRRLVVVFQNCPATIQKEDAEVEERPKKKAKKWFQDDSDDERQKAKSKKGKGKVIEVTDAPDTLEDYEALAAGLLDD